jgi:hypothetical protein
MSFCNERKFEADAISSSHSWRSMRLPSCYKRLPKSLGDIPNPGNSL